MNKHRFTSVACAMALVAGNLSAFAQQAAPQPKVERRVVINENGVVRTITDDKEGPAPDVMFLRSGGPGQDTMVVTPGAGPDIQTFSFVSSEMSFDGKVVKGAPYTADAVQEHVQTLADGNRIVNRTTSQVARDGEGRTRREQTLHLIGVLPNDGEVPKSVFINDPVAGINYVLDARTKTARKLPLPTRIELRGGPAGFTGKTIDGIHEEKIVRIGGGGNGPQNVIKRVQPVYPPVAKAAGVEGRVNVALLIGEDGKVVSAEVVDGHPLLREAALEAARQWEFKPFEVNGKPVKVKGNSSFNFSLDKDGKAREERTLTITAPATAPAPPAAEAGAVAIARTAPRVALAEPAAIGFATGGQVAFMRGPASKHEVKKESLGKQTIEGVECEGTRTTITVPAGEIGNERPIETISERWYSPELQVVVMSRNSDPRSGENTYRLQNIVRSEPSPSLFQVPADYTVKEGPAFAPAMPALPGAPGTFEYRIERKQKDEQKNEKK
jgi:TonB family protein